jgi:hypothetical protein
MIHRTRPSMRWFGIVAALLLVGLPVQADDIEPEPYVEEEVKPEPEPEPEPVVESGYPENTETAATSSAPSPGSKLFDATILRPFGIAATLLGAVFFVPVAVLASPSGPDNIATAWEVFVTSQVDYTFTRRLGDF